MITVNKKMYDSLGRELTIEEIKGDQITATRTRESIVNSNHGKNVETHCFKDKMNFFIKDVGILLFFNKDDYQKHSKLNISDKQYLENKENILAYFGKKYSKEADDIDKYKPIGTVLNKETKSVILHKIRSKQESAEEERALHSKYPNLSKAFGRIDLDTLFYRENYLQYPKMHYYDRVYISKEPYERFDDIHMVNWRAPIASLYYDNNLTFLKRDHYVDIINETKPFGRTEITTGHPNNVYEHELLLKRQYSDKQTTFKNLFVYGDDFFADGAVDPFLLDVMRENRSKHKMVDIIRTIQANQNKIIRHNVKDNIIVQGCAGSGKTMILLHRLSYLLYNKMIINDNKVKIITPNDNFSMFISELAGVLELDKIPRITIKDYYLSKINAYADLAGSYKININPSKGKIDHYDNYDALINTQESVKKINTDFEAKISNLLKRDELSIVETVINRLNIYYNFNSIFERLRILFSACSLDINRKNDILLKDIADRKKLLAANIDFNQTLETKKEKLNQLTEEIKHYINDAEDIKADRSSVENIDNLINDLNKLKNEIIKQNKIINELESEQEKLIRELFETSFIMFVKKSGLKNRINKIIEEKELIIIGLTSRFNSLINNEKIVSYDLITLEASIDEKLKSLRENKQKNDDNTLSIENLNDSLMLNCKHIENRLLIIDQSLFSKIKNILYQWVLTDTNQKVENIINNYISAIRNIVSIINSECHKIAEQNIEYYAKEKEINNKIEELSNLAINQNEKEAIDRLLKKLDNWNLIIQITFNEFINIKREEAKVNNLGGYTEKEAMILLHLCHLYYGPLKANDDFLFIDEGQDYSLIEYKLISDINGGKCIFNIFGDTNQLINSVGIDSWKKIDFLNAINYMLNENYRNTIEITDFVNRKFNYKLIAIGLNGENITLINHQDIEGIIKQEISNNTRIALIYKHEKNVLSYFDVGNEVITFNSVKDVKGLEFDVVIVLPTGMTKNEEYISYTRALNKLYILN